MSEGKTKSAFVAIIGRPNVGKSSLLNHFLGEKVAIVTSKPQTTRTRITGILTKGKTQFVFVDTPGFHKKVNRLSDYMDEAVLTSINDVDIALFMTEAQGRITETEKALLEAMKTKKVKAILVVNKIDLLKDKTQLAARIAELSALYPFDAVVPVSVTQNDGVDLILEELDRLAEEGEHYYPDDALTDQPERVITAEIIREKLLQCLQQEVPHGIAVVIEKQREREDKPIVDIEATIYCEKASHKGIVIGKNGAVLKKVGTMAREDMEQLLGKKVNLKCWVKVQEDWRSSDSMIKNFGLSGKD